MKKVASKYYPSSFDIYYISKDGSTLAKANIDDFDKIKSVNDFKKCFKLSDIK